MPLALITGGSRGLGLALVRALLEDGWEVVTDARDTDALRTATASLGVGVHAVPGDVTSERHRADLAALVRSLGGRLDLLVHNAGALGPSPLPALLDVDPPTLAALLDVNVTAPVALTAALRPSLRAARGTVVTISSDAAVAAYEGWGAYGLTKAALDHVAATLAVEEPTLRVHALDPGDLRTAMHQAAFPGEDISDRAEPATVAPALLRLVRDRPPSGRHRASGLLSVTP